MLHTENSRLSIGFSCSMWLGVESWGIRVKIKYMTMISLKENSVCFKKMCLRLKSLG